MRTRVAISERGLGSRSQGTIPTQFGRLSALSGTLALNDNNFITGTLPTELGGLTALAGTLSLSDNSISGSIPSQFGRLTALADGLYMTGNLLSGTLAPQLGRLTALTRYLCAARHPRPAVDAFAHHLQPAVG